MTGPIGQRVPRAALWAIPVVGLVVAALLWAWGSPVPAGVVAAGSLLTVEPIRRFWVSDQPVVLDADEIEELRETVRLDGEVAAIKRLREMRPTAGLAVAARTVRELTARP